ncbi:MAG: 16S rRNA (uracil(1498)-N(3))-methyltransferase [Magnetospirillum sp.]|nr:16S rRNA (uracil(1498)-N(3))-methyltransferase [Magnetospirillum sp.]
MTEPASRPRLRLFVGADLGPDAAVLLPREQAHYLGAVMRAEPGEAVLLFNGRDGEWRAIIRAIAKNGATLVAETRTRPQAPEPDLWLLAAPIKRERIDLVAEKAAELGVSALWPVFTRRTAMSRVNTDRLAAHMVEAAEQCERLSVPVLREPMPLERALGDWDARRRLLFLDETGGGMPIAAALSALADEAQGSVPPLAVLVGPEGGFAPEEQRMLAALPFVRPVSMGPRILRAETAAIAALAVAQALLGDGRERPRGACAKE